MSLIDVMDKEECGPIAGLSADSRRIKPGWLFAALPGSRGDGRDYIVDAVRHGASAVLAPAGTVLPGHVDPARVALVTDENPRRKFAQLAAHFYGLQPDRVVAVTGTNGKTSCVGFCQQLWHLSGIRSCASIGTLGIRGPGMARAGSMTTPDPDILHAEMADLAAAGITHLAMEASSHGLDQYRLDGVRLGAAAFTNLSRDHLDYHGDMAAYFAAKARLFEEILPPGGTAVLNADDPVYPDIKEICERKGHVILSYGEKGQDIVLKSHTPRPQGQEVVIAVRGQEHKLTLPLVGTFQVMNALCALGLSGADPALLERLRGVPGRLQLVSGPAQSAAVYVDYAHTPDALERVLDALRPHTPGRLVCVIGCGGDRDAGKRPLMGRIAAEKADLAVITDDNPRSEDPAVIRAQMLEGAAAGIEAGTAAGTGMETIREMAGRRDAIGWAVAQLSAGDVLVIAGKGHEQGQVIGDLVEPFDDVEEAKKALAEVKL